MQSHNPKQILFVSRFYIQKSNDGSSVYILDLMEYLKENGFEITYVLLPQLKLNQYPWYKIPEDVSKCMSVDTDRFVRFGRLLIGKFNTFKWPFILIWLIYMQLPLGIKRSYRKFRTYIIRKFKGRKKSSFASGIPKRTLEISSSEWEYIHSLVDKYSPIAIIVDFASLAGVFDAISDSSKVQKILLTHDVLHKREQEFSQSGIYQGDLERGWSFELESIALQKADVIVAIQQEEAKLFRTMSPQNQIITVPMAATLKNNLSRQIPGRCLFVGSGADQNIVAIHWFLREVWGEMLRLNPNASLHVCGTVCESIIKSSSNITLRGRIDDLQQEYDEAEVCIVPLIAGTGLKIKLIEALSYGRVVVSTSIGVQGINELENSGIIVADKPQDFSNAIINIQKFPDVRQLMENNARNFVSNNFSTEICYQPLIRCLNSYIAERNKIDT